MLKRAFLAGVLVLLITVTGRAAGVAVRGTVVDPASTPIPGATVELLAGARLVAKAVSGPDGGFAFDSVAAGNYEIRVTLTGFRQARISLTIGGTAPPPLRVRLLVGSTTESVTVNAPAPVAKASPRAAPSGAAGGVVGDAVGGLPAAPPPGSAVPQAGLAGSGGGAGGGYRIGRAVMPAPSDTATYAPIEENKFRKVTEQPLSTFSIDVDTASYANVRRFLNEGNLPPLDAVRVEELINYFHFTYADSTQGAPFGVTTELASCPWNGRHKLA